MTANRSVDEWQEILGRQVRTARLQADLSQDRLASLADVDVNSLRQLEKGRGSSLQTLVRVVRALGQTSWLESLAPEPTISPLRLLDSSGRAVARQRAPRQVRPPPEPR